MPSNRRLRVAHILPGLNPGGAETLLYGLLGKIDRNRVQSEVISMTPDGEMVRKIEDLGVEVRSLGIQPGIPNPAGILRLRRCLEADPPDVIQGWLYQGNLLATLGSFVLGGIPHLWGVQHTSRFRYKPLTRATVAATRALAPIAPKYIVCCSPIATYGYPVKKVRVVLNAIDATVFIPNPGLRHAVRSELGISDSTVVVGRVARFAPEKDYLTFMRAAGLIRAKRDDVVFVACGPHVDQNNDQLLTWAGEAGVADTLRLLGERHDMPAVMSSLDIIVSSSAMHGEGLPLSIAEAMACGVPCVTTDAGDSALIVGDSGLVVPPSTPAALADSVLRLLARPADDLRAMGLRGRQRVISMFRLDDAARQYEDLWMQAYRDANRR